MCLLSQEHNLCSACPMVSNPGLMIHQCASQDQKGCGNIIVSKHFHAKHYFGNQRFMLRFYLFLKHYLRNGIIQSQSYLNRNNFYSFTVLFTFIYYSPNTYILVTIRSGQFCVLTFKLNIS